MNRTGTIAGSSELFDSLINGFWRPKRLCNLFKSCGFISVFFYSKSWHMIATPMDDRIDTMKSECEAFIT
jgi:hypothetical protein